MSEPSNNETDRDDLPPKHIVRRRARIALIVILIVLVVGTARTIYADMANKHDVTQQTSDGAKQYVEVVQAKSAEAAAGMTLPATLRGFTESPIYARATGYVREWRVDIGAHVKRGQLMALLDTPEVDQELRQAVAQRAQAQATLRLAKISADRWKALRQADAVSQQEVDDRVGSQEQNAANLAAADANVSRLQELESFKRIVAPFDGVVTQRNIDIGDLVSAGSTGSASSTSSMQDTRALFALAQSNVLRIYLSVPQAYSTHVTLGQTVDIHQAEYPKKVFVGKVTHISGAIDVPTRSLQIEISLTNDDRTLYPGAYVQVTLPGATSEQLLIPGNTLLFRAEGPSVAVVGSDNTVHIKPVSIARDDGKNLSISKGITNSDRVIVNPSDTVENGDTVQIAPPKKSKDAKAGEKKGQS